jgi:phosphoribosylformimino-5-aminoimidazole carboxamide ribotide isomerase
MPAAPRLIPVIDVMNGRAVRAVGGRRSEYQPVVSRLTTSTEVYEVAKAVMAACGVRELYVADLDAIDHCCSLTPAVDDLIYFAQYPVWIDAGISGGKDIDILPPSRHIRPVVGLETAGDPQTLARAVRMATAPVAFSLDLRGGELLGDWPSWGAKDARDVITVARTAIHSGAKALIVLDLARVGSGSGTGTEPLLRAVRDEFPDIDLIAGGGVRTWDDVERLGEAGASGVLVASALHDGTLRPR